MAYSFNGSTDVVEFALAPFNGHTFGGFTAAAFAKRGNITSTSELAGLTTAALGNRLKLGLFSNPARIRSGVNIAGPQNLTSTSTWYLIVATRAAGSNTIRFHIHDGSSWNHANASTTTFVDVTVSGTDRLVCGPNSSGGTWEIVCCGIKKSDSADATVETLTNTAFSDWAAFGFEWLIGFDSSLEAAGILQDQGTAGTGDEIAITGTSAVADPGGWSWSGGGGGAVYIPRVISVT